MAGQAVWIAVDWGTSNLRAWGIDADGEIAFSRSSDQGMGKLQRGDYPTVLASLLAGAAVPQSGPMDVWICGMAGARQGWAEAPYLDVPASLSGLAHAAVVPALPESRLRPRILPGVCQKLPGAEDVMRGEETQLLGLSTLLPGYSGLAVMPGTHSKWVELGNRQIERFSTAMTGELFELLRSHSVLRHSMGGEPGAERDAGFDAGLETGLAAPQRLLATLFKVRSSSLLSGRGPAWSTGYLSGLVIGTEIGGQKDWISGGEVPLIGGPALCALYSKGFSLLGAKTRVIDATDATLAGLKSARLA